MTKQGLKKGVQKTKWAQAKLVLIYILLQVLVEHWHCLKVKPKPNTCLKPKPLKPKCLNLKPNWNWPFFPVPFQVFMPFLILIFFQVLIEPILILVRTRGQVFISRIIIDDIRQFSFLKINLKPIKVLSKIVRPRPLQHFCKPWDLVLRCIGMRMVAWVTSTQKQGRQGLHLLQH